MSCSSLQLSGAWISCVLGWRVWLRKFVRSRPRWLFPSLLFGRFRTWSMRSFQGASCMFFSSQHRIRAPRRINNCVSFIFSDVPSQPWIWFTAELIIESSKLNSLLIVSSSVLWLAAAGNDCEEGITSFVWSWLAEWMQQRIKTFIRPARSSCFR